MSIDPETIAVYDARARDYAERFDAINPGRHLRAFLERLPENARVLDLGCGPGNAAAAMARTGHAAEAWDPSTEMIGLARLHQGVSARQASFDDLDAEAEYHGIWANFSLLHAPREKMDSHLAAIARALRPGGIFHIGMKTGDGAARDGIGRRYTFYSEQDLQARLARAGFSVTTRDAGADKGLAGTVDPWVVLLAHKDARGNG